MALVQRDRLIKTQYRRCSPVPARSKLRRNSLLKRQLLVPPQPAAHLVDDDDIFAAVVGLDAVPYEVEQVVQVLCKGGRPQIYRMFCSDQSYERPMQRDTAVLTKAGCSDVALFHEV